MTLAFSWATNANYSTGPDVGTPTKVNPSSTANGFIAGTIAAPQHINFLFDAIGDELIKAVDGVGGGTYTLGSALRFQGADVEINAGLEILAAGELNVQSGGEINVLSLGTLNIESGGSAIVEGAIFVGGGGALNVTTGGVAEIATAEQLTIADEAAFWRLTLTPQAVAQSSNVMTWQPVSPPCGGWVQTNVSAGFQISFPLPLNVGDDILEVSVVVDGAVGVGHGGSIPTGADRLTVTIVRVATDGTVTTLATKADASNAVTYDSAHTIELNSGTIDSGTMPITINNAFAYYVMIAGETGGNAVANTTAITAIAGECVARTYRSALMFY